MKRTIAFILMLVICLAFLPSCTPKEETSAADTFLREFVVALVSEDYQAATKCIHPDSNVKEDDLAEIVSEIKRIAMVDSIETVEFLDRTGLNTVQTFSIDSEKVTTISLEYDILINGKKFQLSATVYENYAGYGITKFNIGLKLGF